MRSNRFGQYRPFSRGIPQTAGYGLTRAEKPIGLIKLEVRLKLDGLTTKLPELPVAFALYNARKLEPYVIDLSSVCVSIIH